MPINLTMWAIAVLPIIVLLILMLKLKWSAANAAPVSLIIALIGGFLFYKSGIDLLVMEMGKGLWNSMTVVFVIFTALLIYEVSNESKAILAIKKILKQVAPNELLRIIGIGLVFVSFLQGVTGFGVPVAVTAPLLIGIGVKPIWSVVIPLIGHAWAGTFGTLAIAWDALVLNGGIEGISLVQSTALYATGFLWVLNLIGGITICWFYGRFKAVKMGSVPILILSTIQSGGQMLISQFNTTLSCFLSSCIALIVFFALNRVSIYSQKWSIEDSEIMDRDSSEEEISVDMNIVEAFLPYVLMTVVTLIVLLSDNIKSFLSKISFGLSFPKTITGYGFVNVAHASYSPFSPFTHASIFLFISAILSFCIYKKKRYIENDGGKNILKRALKKTIPSSIAVISLTMMSRVMSGSGQVLVLATSFSNLLGQYYTVVAPFIGMLGSFITGSNMSSNILFSELQTSSASLLNMNIPTILGGQTAAASVGTAISPSNIVLGATTAGILGSEGKILKKILPIALLIVALFGVIIYSFNS